MTVRQTVIYHQDMLTVLSERDILFNIFQIKKQYNLFVSLFCVLAPACSECFAIPPRMSKTSSPAGNPNTHRNTDSGTPAH